MPGVVTVNRSAGTAVFSDVVIPLSKPKFTASPITLNGTLNFTPRERKVLPGKARFLDDAASGLTAFAREMQCHDDNLYGYEQRPLDVEITRKEN